MPAANKTILKANEMHFHYRLLVAFFIKINQFDTYAKKMIKIFIFTNVAAN